MYRRKKKPAIKDYAVRILLFCRALREGALSRPTLINLPKIFPEFAPSSGGSHGKKTRMTVRSIKDTFEILTTLILELGVDFSVISSQEFANTFKASANEILKIEQLFNENGSDKSRFPFHTYHYIYAGIISRPSTIEKILEIGMGTNNTHIVSNMGPKGSPGASLKAFASYLPNAQIFGADIDRSILFDKDNIKTFYVNQLDRRTFSTLASQLPDKLDLIIDDGLHSPNANLNTLLFAHTKVRSGGWIVIEDINMASIDIWKVTSSLLRNEYKTYLIDDCGTLVFACQKR
jgi:hypothetical protein